MSSDNINTDSVSRTVSNELFNSVVEEYEKTRSVRQSALNCNTSMVTAQRILITAGLWSSKSSRQIAGLLDAGMTPDQIAEKLCLARDTVYTYMPYSRGMYGVEQTDNAQYAKEYRDRMTTAAEGMRHHSTDAAPMPAVELPDAQTEAVAVVDQKDVESTQEASVYALHLSLTDGFLYGADENLGLEPEEKAVFLQLAKAENGITRDILVPGGMNLHALHYAIQKLFGWQNSHLHNFSLSQEDFRLLTNEKFGEYINLCGVLFRFPDEDLNDAYWDDDYETGVSVKTWFKKKYSKPFLQLSVGDSYLGNQWEIDEFRERFPDFTDEMTLQEITEQVLIEQGFNYLIERLRIREIFTKTAITGGHMDVSTWKKHISDEVDFLNGKLTCKKADKLKKAASQLRIWRNNMDYIEKMKWLHPDSYKKIIEETFGKPYDVAVTEHQEGIKFWAKACMPLFREFNICMMPCFNTLYYLYDYGDDWCVKITLQKVYHKQKSGNFVNSDNRPVSDDLQNTLSAVHEKGKPVCVASDGLNLVDDCGGVHGYMNFLETIAGSDKEEADEMRTWARSLGWTGRKSRPENML